MSQPQQVNLKLKGLYTAPNDFSGVPEGALEIADNCVIDYDNLLESRRGFEFVPGNLPLNSDRIYRWANYQNVRIVKYAADQLGYYSGGAYIPYSGTYANPDDVLAKSRFFQANQNLYISSAAGVYKLDAYNSTPAKAGVPKGLDLQLALTGSSGFFVTNETASVTGTTVSASPSLSVLSSTDNISVGQIISGTGIPAGTTVSSITQAALVLSTTGTLTAGSTSMTAVPLNAGLAVNQFILGSGIPSDTRITAIAGAGPYTITMSHAATQSAAGVAVSFYSDPIVTMSANASASGTVTLSFSDGAQVGYRALFGIRDANNNVLLGAPTQFTAIANNSGGTRNVQVTFSIPSGITTSHFYQVYRTPQTASQSIVPTDDEQLVYEGNPSGADLSNGYIQITDNTPDSLRGAFLYTSTSQEGISQANEQPPFCKDFCQFRDFAIYFNVKTRQRKKLTILAVGSPSGIQINDTLTIGGVVFTAKATETIASGEFAVVTSGTPSQNITDTANSLVRVINRYASNTVFYAFLISGPTDLPGQLLIEERGYGAASFALTSSRGGAYTPALPTSGTTVSTAQDVYKNGVMISKQGQPEAVPSTNLLFAGDAAQEGLRCIPTREYVFFLKQDGIFRGTGTTPSAFQISPFDLTTKLICPDSAVSLSNQIYGFFDEGACTVSDTGVQVISRAIETDLKQIAVQAPTEVTTYGFGVAYDTDHKYILSLPISAGDTFTRQQYVYNVATSLWTRWTRSATSGFVDPIEDKLYLGNNSDTASVERKNLTYTDFVDESFAVNIVSFTDAVIQLTSAVGIVAGDILYQSGTVFSIITLVDELTGIVVVEDELTWALGAASVQAAIENEVQWKPIVAGNPMYVRQYSEGIILFKRTRFNFGVIKFYTDISQAFEEVPLVGDLVTGWGLFPWGEAAWGGSNRSRMIRFLVPQEKQMGSLLTVNLNIRNGYSGFSTEGLSMSFNMVNQEAS